MTWMRMAVLSAASGDDVLVVAILSTVGCEREECVPKGCRILSSEGSSVSVVGTSH